MSGDEEARMQRNGRTSMQNGRPACRICRREYARNELWEYAKCTCIETNRHIMDRNGSIGSAERCFSFRPSMRAHTGASEVLVRNSGKRSFQTNWFFNRNDDRNFRVEIHSVGDERLLSRWQSIGLVVLLVLKMVLQFWRQSYSSVDSPKMIPKMIPQIITQIFRQIFRQIFPQIVSKTVEDSRRI